jgi:GNAT superfamily N-acetyltransferase
MQNKLASVQVREVTLSNPKTAARLDGIVFTGPGREVVERIAQETAQGSAAVIDAIVHRLLVKKGADWTNIILSEYLELYDDSTGSFSLVWDKASRQLVAHGSSFQSKTHPGAALVAHIRADDAFRGLGLGTLVTEEVTRRALDRGAQVVVLGTDDKRHRIQQGEKAAFSMYSKLGYAILAEKELTDTIEWLMVVDRASLDRCVQEREAAGGRFPKENSAEVRRLQQDLVDSVRAQFSRELHDGQTSPVGEGDLANLFLLMNLCPPDDFQVKLAAWGVQLGPEMERGYIVHVRPGIADRDRLEDASLALRDRHGTILAVCAAKRAFPFSRNAMDIDFYCLPRFFAANRPAVVALVQAVLTHIEQSPQHPSPCRLLFSGVDQEKIRLFQELGFAPTGNTYPYFTADGQPAFQATECGKTL